MEMKKSLKGRLLFVPMTQFYHECQGSVHKNKFSCCHPCSYTRDWPTGYIFTYCITSDDTHSSPAPRTTENYTYHIPIILCQVVKTEVLLLPESAHHKRKIILSLKCQHFIKNKLTNLWGKTF